MNDTAPHHWYVLQTKPQKEESVCLHLQNVAIETFNPKIQSFGAAGGVQIKPLFPSYIFAKAPLSDPNVHQLVRFTRGVIRVLGLQSQPVPIDQELVDLIRARVNNEGIMEHHLTFKSGDAVRIKRGAFRDLMGILEKPVSAAGRVGVLLQLMQRQIRVVFHCSQLARCA